MIAIHVTNWSSRKLHGPGRKWTIMAAPRAWEHGEGRVEQLTPLLTDLQAVRDGSLGLAEYRNRFMREAERYALSPGRLLAMLPPAFETFQRVQDGDTLCCACSRAAAERGECHRVWAAELLHIAGWVVVLDGRTL